MEARMTYSDPFLMRALLAMQIAPADAKLSFEQRLAEDNGWSRDFALKVSTEYRRFLYLAATGKQPVTPSDAVDQAWHLHLAYSRHYWDILCKEILRKPLHHGPTAGGGDEVTRYAHQYAATLRLYQESFGENAPAAIWPESKRRFGTRYQRIEMGKHWMIPKSAGYAGLAALVLAGCSQTGGDPWIAVGIIFALIIGSYLMVRFARPGKNKGDKSGCGAGCGVFGSSDSDSGCGGGCGGGGD
jgi:hypothetical protein